VPAPVDEEFGDMDDAESFDQGRSERIQESVRKSGLQGLLPKGSDLLSRIVARITLGEDSNDRKRIATGLVAPTRETEKFFTADEFCTGRTFLQESRYDHIRGGTAGA
jgi:hypothetical protein